MSSKPIQIEGEISQIATFKTDVFLTVEAPDGKSYTCRTALEYLDKFHEGDIIVLTGRKEPAKTFADKTVRPAGYHVSSFSVKAGKPVSSNTAPVANALPVMEEDEVPGIDESSIPDAWKIDLAIESKLSELTAKKTYMNAIGLRSVGKGERARLEKDYERALADLATFIDIRYSINEEFALLVEERSKVIASKI